MTHTPLTSLSEINQHDIPRVIFNPESCAILEVNEAACHYYGLPKSELINQPVSALGHIDLLTQLPNRKLFLDRLQQAVVESQRHNTQFALLFIDLDHFKPVNDTLGHQAGDDVLVSVAKRLNAILREEDTLARLGGDEFVVLLKDVSDVAGIERVTGKCLDALIKPFTVTAGVVELGGSIGISLFPQDARTPAELLKKADLAMYRSKQNGRNQWSFFQAEMDQEAQARFKMELDIRNALKNDGFKLNFLPIFDIQQQALFGFETQLAWQDEFASASFDMGAIQSLANQSYLGIKLSEWRLTQGLADFERLLAFNPALTCHLFVSPIHFKQSDFVEWMEQTAAHYRVDPEQIYLSVLPESLQSAHFNARERVEHLLKLGFQCVVEEFGLQVGSLFKLADLDLSGIRMTNFEWTATLNQSSRKQERLVGAILAFAKELSPNLIATGVKDKDHLSLMQSHQCQYAQGAVFGDAIDAEHLEAYMSDIPQFSEAIFMDEPFEKGDVLDD